MRAKKKSSYSTKSIGVRELLTKELHPNPHNPRMLFDPLPLKTLQDSIQKVGILVPLTVYRDKAKRRYVILDGQRRWLCASELRYGKVPVNIVPEPNLVQNIVTMFQIHKLREDWELMPTALKLEILMHELDEMIESKLAILTGLDKAVVSRCKKLLSYSRRYQNMMLDPNPANRVKADFFIELYAVRNDRVVNSMKWFKRDHFTNEMLKRYRVKSGGLKAVTDFRRMKQDINNAVKAGKKREITTRLKKFTEDHTYDLKELSIESAQTVKHVRSTVTLISKLEKLLRGIETKRFYGEKELWRSLEKLQKLIKKKLAEADRRPRE